MSTQTIEPAVAPAEASRRTGLSIDALRYYEREGLVGPVARVGGKRRYTEGELAWIGLLTCLREAGLGIDDLRRFTALLKAEGQDEDRIAFLRRRRAELEDRADRLRSAVRVLDEKIAYYS